MVLIYICRKSHTFVIVLPFIQALHLPKRHEDHEAVAPLHSADKVIAIRVLECLPVLQRPGFFKELRICY